MPLRFQSEPTTTERIVGGLCYLTFGVAGLIYIILTRPSQSQQFRFHFVQSIILSVIGTLASWGLMPLLSIIFAVLSKLMPESAVAGLQTGMLVTIGILTNAFYLLLLYGAVCAWLAKFAEVPFISNVVRQNMSR